MPVQSLEKQLQQVDVELEETAGRITVMGDHMKNVQQEMTYAQHRVSEACSGQWTGYLHLDLTDLPSHHQLRHTKGAWQDPAASCRVVQGRCAEVAPAILARSVV